MSDQYDSINYEMFTPEGEALCHEAMGRIVNAVHEGTLTRLGLSAAIEAARNEIEAAGHGEVFDTECRYGFADAANILCKEQGWIGFDSFLDDK